MRNRNTMHRLQAGDMISPAGQLDLAEILAEYKFQSAIKRLSRGVTHDYNNIFAGLSGQLAMQARDNHTREINTDRRRMVENLLQRGIDRTSMFFEFCRLQNEPPKLLQPIRIAEKAVDLLNCVSRLHHFDLQQDQSALPKISGCYRDLLLLLFYLGENSIDATPDGGMVRLSVKLETVAGKDPEIVIEIADDGCGFPTEILDTENIASLLRTTGDKVVSGAGLFTAARIVEEHGGKLLLSSSKNEGALAQIVLPAASQNYTELESLEWGTKKKKAIISPRPAEKFILLIVDDEESIRTLLLDQFQRRGHVAFCVSSCEEAVQEYKELSDIITAVLLDVGLSDCTGYECLSQLRKIKPDIRVIMMSGEEFTGTKENYSNINYVRKPFTVEMVERLCRQ